MSDVRMETTNSVMYNIRRTAFVIKNLGKEYYPEPILGLTLITFSNLLSSKGGDNAS